jgi:hypothetical protein
VAGIDAARDPRGAAWERRLRRPVLAAAWLAIPTVLLAARALSSVQGVRVLQVLYLAKAAKLLKSALILRAGGAAPRHPVALAAAALVGAIALVGIGDRIVSGDKHPTPFHGTWSLVEDAVP